MNCCVVESTRHSESGFRCSEEVQTLGNKLCLKDVVWPNKVESTRCSESGFRCSDEARTMEIKLRVNDETWPVEAMGTRYSENVSLLNKVNVPLQREQISLQ